MVKEPMLEIVVAPAPMAAGEEFGGLVTGAAKVWLNQNTFPGGTYGGAPGTKLKVQPVTTQPVQKKE